PRKKEARDLARARRLMPPREPQAQETPPAGPRLVLDGLLRGGWRFADITGNERAFDEDFDLDPGPRLSDLELELHAAGLGPLLSGSLHGLEDRDLRARLATGAGLSERLGASGEFQRVATLFAGSGDFHRLSRRRRDVAIHAHLQDSPAGARRLELDYTRHTLRGTTLSSRIGNQNQSPILPALDVPAELRLEDELVSLAFETRPSWGSWSLELGWNELREREDLAFSRPSPVNPNFTESELGRAGLSRRGPEARLRAELGGPSQSDTELGLLLFGSYLESRFVERGSLTAFDGSGFTTDTLALGTGRTRLLGFEANLLLPLGEGTTLDLGQGMRDHRDRSLMSIFDTTTRVSPPLVTVTRSNLDLLVRLRELNSDVSLVHELFGGLELRLGYRYLFQRLLLPDLEPNDADFRSGDLNSHGPDLGLVWKPDARHRLSLRFEQVDVSGRTPTDTQQDFGWSAEAKLRRKLGKDGHLELFGRWRDQENELSSTSRDVRTWGASLGATPWSEAELLLSGSWARIRSLSLSSFFFRPATTPVPTVVGFRGETALLELGLDTPLLGSLRSSSTLALQRSRGSLSAMLLQYGEELSVRLSADLSFGLRASVFDYEERSGIDDYDALVALLFAELRF
ncbi:MAG: hypothetical protein ACE5F1_13545, partial [Planctomycetota bacterium]